MIIKVLFNIFVVRSINLIFKSVYSLLFDYQTMVLRTGKVKIKNDKIRHSWYLVIARDKSREGSTQVQYVLLISGRSAQSARLGIREYKSRRRKFCDLN